MSTKHEYIIGNIYNIVKLIDLIKDKDKKCLMAKTKCVVCGKEKYIRARDIYGRQNSCVCQNKIHGDSESRLFHTYHNMRYRCNTPTSQSYENYGGRGIKVCEEWDNSYEEFRTWAIANGYSDNLSIDRIDNDGNYEPSNCQWIPLSENVAKANRAIHRRKADKGTYYGVSPSGEMYIFENANQFAKDNDLHAGCVRACANGSKKTHKGWVFGFLNSN